MADSRLKDRLSISKFLIVPGVFDMMSLLMTEKVGFDAVYASGYWTAASHLGIPDFVKTLALMKSMPLKKNTAVINSSGIF